MNISNGFHYLARLTAFKPVLSARGGGIVGKIAAARKAGGLDSADLNYPDHLDG